MWVVATDDATAGVFGTFDTVDIVRFYVFLFSVYYFFLIIHTVELLYESAKPIKDHKMSKNKPRHIHIF